ncbi:hypothetical protein SKAU_G00299780 [Synaphobranchus kaupii]|uniref:Uncharacterized protein n=1 Tax=Synaphobranchus kaupii TaxID=118154 RepID=A0A9Q1EVI0_SYNKA|nr:hypothetical protein SKAU_G00299780 [Synaphobranchus kaupii]
MEGVKLTAKDRPSQAAPQCQGYRQGKLCCSRRKWLKARHGNGRVKLQRHHGEVMSPVCMSRDLGPACLPHPMSLNRFAVVSTEPTACAFSSTPPATPLLRVAREALGQRRLFLAPDRRNGADLPTQQYERGNGAVVRRRGGCTAIASHQDAIWSPGREAEFAGGSSGPGGALNVKIPSSCISVRR